MENIKETLSETPTDLIKSKDGLQKYCDLTNKQLSTNSSPVRLVVAAVVMYQVVGVREEEAEAFKMLSEQQQNTYHLKYREYTSKMFDGVGGDLPYPSIYKL